jgi:hypothetical protein
MIDMQRQQFNAVFRLEDSNGQKLAESHYIQPGGGGSARLLFTPSRDGTYRLVTSSFQQQGTGEYTLVVREFTVPKK